MVLPDPAALEVATPIFLRACYAMSGTDGVYCATSRSYKCFVVRVAECYSRTAPPLWSYACAMLCPVLAHAMLLYIPVLAWRVCEYALALQWRVCYAFTLRCLVCGTFWLYNVW
eukprot:874060-Rhodomonas_salina.3